jgi:hypothetical protein
VPRRAERAQLLLVFAPGVFEDLPRERRDDRRHEHGLRDHHRSGREKNTELAERPRARKQEIDEEPDHDGGQPHQGIEENDERVASGKPLDRERRAQRQPDERGDQHRSQAHLHAQRDDVDELGIETPDHAHGFRKRAAYIVHVC